MTTGNKCGILAIVVWLAFFLSIISYSYTWLPGVHAVLHIYFAIFSFVGGVFCLVGWLDE
jgi:uncharacterized membrane protein